MAQMQMVSPPICEWYGVLSAVRRLSAMLSSRRHVECCKLPVCVYFVITFDFD